MPTTARQARERLLDAALERINEQGFAATSIDRIIETAGVTKGTFFYHFKSKNELARALLDRFAAADQALLADAMSRAERLGEGPLGELLVFAGLMIEVAENLDATPHPGCLFATYCYEGGLFDDETKQVIAEAIESWREALLPKLRAAAAEHPPSEDVDLESLADMLTVLFEGAFVLARSTSGRSVFADQIRHYRTYLKLLFAAS